MRVPAARNVFYLLCNCTVDSPRAFSVSNWSHAAVACTGGIWAGGFDPFLSNRFSSWAERRASKANRRQSREREALSPRDWYTWARTAIVRREATCWSVPLAWKNGTLTFSVDYKETGKAMLHYPIITESQNCSQIEMSKVLSQWSWTEVNEFGYLWWHSSVNSLIIVIIL